VSSEPVWIIEGELPARASVSVDASPFGFHPALAPGVGFGTLKKSASAGIGQGCT
jgi:hypothetical protein